MWQKIYDDRADSFYLDDKIISVENLPPLEIRIADELKSSGRELIESLSFADVDFSATLKTFRKRP